jgi:hypothetical protein
MEKSPTPFLFAIMTTLVCVQYASADSLETTIEVPDFDRWMYPYNATAGSREVSPTFSSIGESEDFDQRDGQVLLGFITPEEVPVGLGPSNYSVTEATVFISISNDGIVYDSSMDPWESWVEDSGVEDPDAGRPIELFGAAFRNDFNGWSFGESGPFPFGAGRGERNAYPVAFINGIDANDVSNNVAEAYNPVPFGVGSTNAVNPGDVLPTETVLSFSIDVSDPAIQCYLRNGFNDGLMSFVVTSLHPASYGGPLKGNLSYPNFHMKESLAVFWGIADPAQFSFSVQYDETITDPADLDGDGTVGVNDLLVALGDWGFCTCCSSDLNADGEVNVTDLLAIVAAWGPL